MSAKPEAPDIEFVRLIDGRRERSGVLLGLKIAIIRSGLTQREVSLRARIPESRLSHIVRRRTIATAAERGAVATVLALPADRLFADSPPEAA